MEYYSILGVEKTETKDGIKKAYRKLAMQYHPDRNKGDKNAEKKFKEINEAYSILGDDTKRQEYDMFGKNGGRFSNGFSGSGVDVDLGDIFESFFGGGFSNSKKDSTREQRGEDIQKNIEINLKTSIYGGKQTIEFNKKETCKICNGEGGKGKKVCSKCSGSGRLTKTTQSIFGMVSQTVICDECSGSGEIFEEICDNCNGEKRKFVKKELDIDIPAGIDDSMVIRINEEGNSGINTKASGDLYIKFSVILEEKGLKRDGVNLYYNLEIEIVEAVLGTSKEINIPIIGKRNIEIKSGSNDGTIIKIIGDGVKYIDKDKKGDLFITLKIKIPKKLSKKERELYENIAREKKIKVNSPGVFGKIFC